MPTSSHPRPIVFLPVIWHSGKAASREQLDPAARAYLEAGMQVPGRERRGLAVVWLADGETFGADVVIVGFERGVPACGSWSADQGTRDSSQV